MFWNYDKPGKGIDPEAEKKTGFAWFLDIISREFWGILQINLLFLLYSIPIFTVGASFGAMNTLLIRMVKDVPVDVFSDFKDAFLENFKQSTLVCLVQGLVLGILGLNVYFYWGKSLVLVSMVWLSIGFFMLLSCYLGPMMVSVKLKWWQIFANSMILAVVHLKSSLILLFFWGVSGLGFLWYFPYTIFLPFLGGIAFCNFVNCFLCYDGIVRYCQKKVEE